MTMRWFKLEGNQLCTQPKDKGQQKHHSPDKQEVGMVLKLAFRDICLPCGL